MRKMILLVAVVAMVVLSGCGRQNDTVRVDYSKNEDAEQHYEKTNEEKELDEAIKAFNESLEEVNIESITFCISSEYNVRSSMGLEKDNVILKGYPDTGWFTKFTIYPDDLTVQRHDIDKAIYYSHCFDNCLVDESGELYELVDGGGMYAWLHVSTEEFLAGDYIECSPQLIKWCEEHQDESLWVVLDGVTWSTEVSVIQQ